MKLIRNAGVAYILALFMIPSLAEGQVDKDSLSCCRSVWEEIRKELKEAHVEMKEELAEMEWEAMKKELQQEMKKVRNAIDSAYRELERELQNIEGVLVRQL